MSKPKRSLSHDQIKKLIENAPGDHVQGLVPENSVNINVGDSGLGKSPLYTQQGLCVAHGLPFLNLPTRQGRVLWVDYENAFTGLDSVLDTLCSYLQIPGVGENFRILLQPDRAQVEEEIRLWKPAIVYVDALRGYDSDAELKNSAAAHLINQCQKMCSLSPGLSWEFIHHPRKTQQQTDALSMPEDLLTCKNVLTWLEVAAGARALINQTSTRIGIETYKGGHNDVELILRGHYKLRGNFGPIYIARDYNDEGDPIGYRRVVGRQLLTPKQLEVLIHLPHSFRFKEVSVLSGNDKTTAEFLRKSESIGLIRKSGAGKNTRYEKTDLGL